MFTKMKLGRDPPPEFKVYKIQFQMAPKSLEAYQHAVDHYTSILLVRCNHMDLNITLFMG